MPLTLTVSGPEKAAYGDRIRLRWALRWNGGPAAGPDSLWFEFDRAHEALLSDAADAPLVALVIPAMAAGASLRVRRARVSARLLYHLQTPYQSLVRNVMPWLSRIEIDADTVGVETLRARGVATGFSGGIDSFCVLADHLIDRRPPGFAVTHLLLHNVGSHGATQEKMFRLRYARLRPAADRLGVPFVSINSNLDAFYRDPRLNFQQTHTARNCAAALSVQAGIGTYLYASSYAHASIFVGPSYDLAYTDPIGVPMLSTEALQMHSVGSEYTRVEKTLRIASVREARRSLDVCVWPDRVGNCSRCWKCMRTELTLDVAGLLEPFADVFDLSVYRPRRTRFIGEVLQSRSPLMREIIPFAQERRFPIPLASRTLSLLPLDRLREMKKALRPARATRGAIAPVPV